jgi:aryl-alcohol dehydrogenase-like predicted oxidoreductase
MQLGIGTSEFHQSSQVDWKNYFASARTFGYQYIDTSPFYSGASSERTIGDFLDPGLQFKIITKFGLPYYDLGSIYGKISKRLKGSSSISREWGSHLSPKFISKELKSSLSRLKVSDCHGYLMHSVEATVDHDYWVESLLTLKNAGLTENIGLSVDSPIEADFSWADILQIPANLMSWPRSLNFKGVVMINGFARPDATELNARVAEARSNFPNGIGILRSSSLEHLKHFAYLAQEDETL